MVRKIVPKITVNDNVKTLKAKKRLRKNAKPANARTEIAIKEIAVEPHKIVNPKDDNPNKANIRFLVDGAEIDDLAAYERVIIMFDGHDSDAVTQARSFWKRLKEQSHDLTYWQQGDGGRWQKKA